MDIDCPENEISLNKNKEYSRVSKTRSNVDQRLAGRVCANAGLSGMGLKKNK